MYAIWMTQNAFEDDAMSEWQFHHDNAPTQASHLVQNFFEKHQITKVTQSPYSSDLTPCDFWFSQI